MEAVQGSEESSIKDAEKLRSQRKQAAAYMRERVKNLDKKMAENFVQTNYALAAGDAREMAELLLVLSRIDLES